MDVRSFAPLRQSLHVARNARVGRLLRFACVGIVSNLCLLAVFVVLTRAGMNAVAAAVAVYLLGVSGTYLANRSWSFRSDAPHPVAGPRYLLVHALGAGTQAMLQFVAHTLLGFDAVAVQVIGMILVAFLVFALLDAYAFRNS